MGEVLSAESKVKFGAVVGELLVNIGWRREQGTFGWMGRQGMVLARLHGRERPNRSDRQKTSDIIHGRGDDFSATWALEFLKEIDALGHTKKNRELIREAIRAIPELSSQQQELFRKKVVLERRRYDPAFLLILETIRWLESKRIV